MTFSSRFYISSILPQVKINSVAAPASYKPADHKGILPVFYINDLSRICIFAKVGALYRSFTV